MVVWVVKMYIGEILFGNIYEGKRFLNNGGVC